VLAERQPRDLCTPALQGNPAMPDAGQQGYGRSDVSPSPGSWADIAPTDIADFLAEPIPPRQWLLGPVLCRQFVSVIAAAGGSGKTSLLIAMALSLASGRDLLGLGVHHRARVLILSFEDGADELRRRLTAACRHHRIDPADLREWLHVASLNRSTLTLMTTDDAGNVIATDAEEGLVALCRREDIEAVTFDPWVKLSGAPENDNRATDAAVNVLGRVADRANVAVALAHHTRKGPAEAGNTDSARGAKALIDAARIGLTLTPMTSQEAQTFNVPEADRRRYVRLDDGKLNLTFASADATWFRLASVRLDNGTADYPDGDDVQTVEPWSPPATWAGLSGALIKRILDAIDAGLPDGERYSDAPNARDRAAWRVVEEHTFDKSEKQCREIVNSWVGSGQLRVEEYKSGGRRSKAKGLFVDPTKRPGAGQPDAPV
jgi:hypothetical protein